MAKDIHSAIKENAYLNGDVEMNMGNPSQAVDNDRQFKCEPKLMKDRYDLVRHYIVYDAFFIKWRDFYFAKTYKDGCFVFVEIGGEVREFEHISFIDKHNSGMFPFLAKILNASQLVRTFSGFISEYYGTNPMAKGDV